MGEPANSRFERRGRGAQRRIWWWLARSNAGTGGRGAARAGHGRAAAGGGTRESVRYASDLVKHEVLPAAMR